MSMVLVSKDAVKIDGIKSLQVVMQQPFDFFQCHNILLTGRKILQR